MARVQPTPALVLVDDTWVPGTIRTCEPTPDGKACTAVVSYGGTNAVTTGRFHTTQIRSLDGTPGCPITPPEQ